MFWRPIRLFLGDDMQDQVTGSRFGAICKQVGLQILGVLLLIVLGG